MKNKLFTTTTKLFIVLCCVLASWQSKAQCNPSFTYSLGSAGLVNFYSTSTGTSSTTQYFWNFGDGLMSNTTYSNGVSHTYTTNNVYSVTLYISDSTTNCFSNYTQTVAITAMGCNHNLVIGTAMGSNGQVSFSSNANFPGMTHAWAFGDGGTSTATNPSHIYTTSGAYTATLISTTPWALCTYTATKNLTVNVAPCSLNANFNFVIGNNGNVSFVSTSTGTTSNTQYYWSFGDGNYGNGVSTNHLYNSSTIYNVMLTVSDTANTNCLDTVMKTVNVTNAPCVNNTNFSITKDSTQALTWNAYPNFPGNVTAVVWSWGDGSSSSIMYPSHTYSASGTYSICVSSTLSCGSATTFCMNSNIYKSSQSNAIVQLNVVNPNGPVGILQNASSVQHIQLYPNPSSGESLISITGAEPEQTFHITVYDMLGKIKYERSAVATAPDFTEKLDLSTISDGIYFVRVDGSSSYTTKIVLHK